MEDDDPVSIGLLGPVVVRRSGQEVYIGPARQRDVLGVLALRVGQAVTVGEIATEVWGVRQPGSVGNLVHTYVGRLRGALDATGEPGLLRSNRPGYTLTVPPRGVDVVRFEESVRRARVAAARSDLPAAASAFESALGLWRGPVLPRAAGPFAEAERVRLNELRHEATEGLVLARLLIGDVSGLVPELKEMIDQEPLRERLWALLMAVLGQTARTAEALTVYQEARATLAERLGVEPGHELQQLYRSLLRGEPAGLGASW